VTDLENNNFQPVVAANPVHVNDFHTTLWHVFGLDHLRLTHRFQGRDFRPTEVSGKVINE
jgi:hypothetical protein